MSRDTDKEVSDEVVQRAQGCFVGLACGDALGRLVEFKSATQIADHHGKVTEMLADGSHAKPAGTITDDTDLALCIARSLATEGGFDGDDVAQRFLDWYESGPFDIGLMMADAIRAYRDGVPWDHAGATVWESRSEGQNAGNGSAMRCLPYALAYHQTPLIRQFVTKQSSAITHADPRCTYGCILLNDIIASYLTGETVSLESVFSRLHPESPEELQEAIYELREIEPESLSTSGYVIDTLQTALYDAVTAVSAEAAICRAVNRGGDTDTIGAITGALVGARFGMQTLPDRWIATIDEAAELRELAATLIGLSQHSVSPDETGVPETAPAAPTYLKADPPVESGGHRPAPAPHQILDTSPQSYTPADVVRADWLHRAYRRAVNQEEPQNAQSDAIPDELRFNDPPVAVRVPEYRRAETFADLPTEDQQRINREIARSVDATEQAVASVRTVRDTIETMPQIPTHGQLYALLRTPESKLGTISDEAQLRDDPQRLQRAVAAAHESARCLTECCSLLAAEPEIETQAEALKAAESALGAAQSCSDGLFSAAIRHPEIARDALPK
jgi:ADP-ribosyl-[dinitrogen reductase] hydrolase